MIDLRTRYPEDALPDEVYKYQLTVYQAYEIQYTESYQILQPYCYNSREVC